jgi:hypothetical protein
VESNTKEGFFYNCPFTFRFIFFVASRQLAVLAAASLPSPAHSTPLETPSM